ncbi:MAG: dockerin type I repeat-containing protein [Clostridia bacterium]|nr:dockerin type I repeat-containing protein [Clostridia bacterium]
MRKTLKKSVSLLLALLMLATIAPLRFQAAGAPVAGDVNLDGKVGSDDARLALRASVKLENLTADQTKCADANRDGKVGSDDARLILRASVKLETLKPLAVEMKRTTLSGAALAPYRSADHEIVQLDSVTDGSGGHVILDDYVTVTFNLPKGLSEQEKLSYAGVYFNENTEPFYLLPDPDALDEDVVSFRTLHFSTFGLVHMTEKKKIEVWCDRAAAQDVSRRITEADITPQLTEMIGDALNNYGLGKDQYAGAVVRYILSHDTRGEILTAAVDGDMEALRSKLISGAGEYFLGKFLEGEGEEVLTQSFGDHEAAIRKSMKDKDYATATVEIIKNIEKNMYPALSYTEKFAGLVDKLADIWTDDMMNEQYAVYERMMDKDGYVSDSNWGIIYTQLRGAANRLSSRGVTEQMLRDKFMQRYKKDKYEIAPRREELKKLVKTWEEDNLLENRYWPKGGSKIGHPTITEKLNSLLAIRNMLKRDILTVGGYFRKGKSFEWSTNDEFLDYAVYKWVTLGPGRRAEFFQWLRDEGIITSPPVTYPPEYAWVLVDTKVEARENTNTGIYKDTYSASETQHSHTAAYIGDEEKAQHASFTGTCDTPPAVIRDGDQVVLHLSLNLTDSNDKDYHFGEYASVRRDIPDMGIDTVYSGFERFKATAEGEPDSCSVTAIGDWGNPPVRITSATVCHTFGGPSKEYAQKMDDGSYRIAVYFNCCGAHTVWVYEWKNLAE